MRAHADNLVVRHGCDAFRINGDAMVAARRTEELDRYRFLKEVSGELAARLAMESRMGLDPIEELWMPGAVQDSASD